MKISENRTIEDRLETIETEVHQIKMMFIQYLSGQKNLASDDTEILMNVKDVARFLKVETAFVYTACNKGEIPFLKIGKLYKFKKTDVLKWLEKEKNNKPVDVEAYVNSYLQKNILKG
ncbi:MAG: helix-turn-helix domain-containing protein [Chitinophagaceae bacterium]|nr:helix-turn-helix domain-containing protein [Chitinophagaceae bacterium]